MFHEFHSDQIKMVDDHSLANFGHYNPWFYSENKMVLIDTEVINTLIIHNSRKKTVQETLEFGAPHLQTDLLEIALHLLQC